MLPPLTGAAVNVTGVPSQILLSEATILIDGDTGAVTFRVTLLLVTLTGVAQAALLVIMQLTTSPLEKLLPLNVALLVPELLPLSNH